MKAGRVWLNCGDDWLLHLLDDSENTENVLDNTCTSIKCIDIKIEMSMKDIKFDSYATTFTRHLTNF